MTYTGPSQTNETVSYTYDNLGRKSTVTDSANTPGAISYNYDAITGNVSQVASPQGTVNYSYDPATGLHTETSTASSDTLYGYDLFGRLASVSVVKQNGNPPPSPTTTYAPFDARGDSEPSGQPTTLYVYDFAGNLVRVLNPNGSETDYAINPVADTQSTTNKVTASGTVLSSYAYLLDADGRKTSVTESRAPSSGSTPFSTTIILQYDALSRLTSEAYNNDQSGQPVSADDYTDAYKYDLAGNRVQKQHILTNNQTSNQKINYAYNPDDQLTSEGTDNAFNTNTAVQYTKAYNYDANGSMTAAGVNSYTYDVRNRLISATVGGTTSTYVYDDDGNRVSQTVVGTATTTTYVLDKNNPSGYAQILEEHAATLTSYVLGLSGAIAQDANGTLSYLVPDGHGSTRLLSDTGGAIKTEYDYDAFGNTLSLTTGAPWNTAGYSTEILYAGEPLEAATGTYLLNVRRYGASIGRFESMDPRLAGPGDLGNTNLYVYVGGNPLNATDSSGHGVGLGEFLTSIALEIAFQAIRIAAYTPYFVQAAAVYLTLSYLAWKIVDEQLVYFRAQKTDGWNELGDLLEFSSAMMWQLNSVLPQPEPEPEYEPPAPAPQAAPRGAQNGYIVSRINVGNRVHYDQLTDPSKYTHQSGPSAVQARFPNTQFQFARRGQAGPDVTVKGGTPPWTYPSSSWPKGATRADFKPDTPAGRARPLPFGVFKILYNPDTGGLNW